MEHGLVCILVSSASEQEECATGDERRMTRNLKRYIAAVTIAAALSTLAPAASSFFVFSSFPAPPSRGGMSVIHKTAAVPGWMTEVSAGQAVPEQSAMADETRSNSGAAPI